jgi:hypothetical protein
MESYLEREGFKSLKIGRDEHAILNCKIFLHKERERERRTEYLIVDLTNYPTLLKLEFLEIFLHDGHHWGWSA